MTLIKKIHIIINPAAGQDTPILNHLDHVFKNKVDWDVSVTHKAGDAKKLAQKALQNNVDTIAIHGGDGTLMEVAEVLQGKDTLLAILAGGTANIMAKELAIPVDIAQSIELLRPDNFAVKSVDLLMTNSYLHLLRTSIGVLAEMVTDTKREHKKQFGSLAYGITAVQKLSQKAQTTYTMTLDGKKYVESGEGLLIVNSGNVGITGTSLIPDVSVNDGLLDVILIRNTDLTSILTIATNTIMQTANNPPHILKHWKAKEAIIKIEPKQAIVSDDLPLDTSELNVKIIPRAIKIIVPK